MPDSKSPPKIPFTAYYNAPGDVRDLVANFGTLIEARAYAEAYGGEVEAAGTAFFVRDADHKQAQDDARKEREAAGKPGQLPPSEIDAAVAQAVERAQAALRAEFEADRAAWIAEREAADAAKSSDPEATPATAIPGPPSEQPPA